MSATLFASAADASWAPAGLAIQLALLLGLVVLSAMFSGSETVLFSLTPHQLHLCAESHNPFRRLAARLMHNPKRTLSIILVGNTSVNVLLYATTYVMSRNLEPLLGLWVTPVAALISVVVVLVGGEVVPKVLAVSLAERMAPYSATVVEASGTVLRPVARLIDWVLVEPLTRLLFGRPGHAVGSERSISPEELKTLLEFNRREGLIDATEDVFLREVIDLNEIRVREIMIPRVEITAFDANRPTEELRDLMRRTRLTKVPVHDGSIDNVLGLIYAKVLFLNPDQPLRKLLSPVAFVPDLISGEQLLRHFRQTGSQTAIAVDEFGGVAGLVTLEDVLEEIVGEIYDPEDRLEEPEIRQLPDGAYEISGRLSVRYWAETFGLPQQTERVSTVGGLVLSRLGRSARVNDRVHIGNVELLVTKMRGRRIDRLHLELVNGAACDSATEAGA